VSLPPAAPSIFRTAPEMNLHRLHLPGLTPLALKRAEEENGGKGRDRKPEIHRNVL